MSSSTRVPANLQELADLVESFNQTTERLRQSHERLQARVAELSRELEAKSRELARKNRLAVIGETAACLAHEIRNPLGGIALYAGLLQRDVASLPGASALVDKIRAGVEHLNRLVQDLLGFANGVQIQAAPCDLARVVEEALVLAGGALLPKAVRVERRFASPPQALRAEADAGLLQRVFLNVLLNAAEVMGEGGALTIRLEPEARGGRPGIAARFADTGTGIPSEALDRLFTPFYTNKARGTGLGLSTAHQIVAAHGGTIEAANNPDRGATFTVWIPLAPPRGA